MAFYDLSSMHTTDKMTKLKTCNKASKEANIVLTSTQEKKNVIYINNCRVCCFYNIVCCTLGAFSVICWNRFPLIQL